MSSYNSISQLRILIIAQPEIRGGASMAHLVSDSSGEILSVPEGDNSIGRGPLLKVYT